MSCEYESTCLNSSKCFRCYDQSLLKLKHEKRKSFASQSTQKDRNKKDSWKSLEQDVANKLNQVPTITEARRSRCSGALWFEKGDIVDDILHPECKERTANELKSGEHSMSIKREWLEKAKNRTYLQTYKKQKIEIKTIGFTLKFIFSMRTHILFYKVFQIILVFEQKYIILHQNNF